MFSIAVGVFIICVSVSFMNDGIKGAVSGLGLGLWFVYLGYQGLTKSTTSTSDDALQPTTDSSDTNTTQMSSSAEAEEQLRSKTLQMNSKDDQESK